MREMSQEKAPYGQVKLFQGFDPAIAVGSVSQNKKGKGFSRDTDQRSSVQYLHDRIRSADVP